MILGQIPVLFFRTNSSIELGQIPVSPPNLHSSTFSNDEVHLNQKVINIYKLRNEYSRSCLIGTPQESAFCPVYPTSLLSDVTVYTYILLDMNLFQKMFPIKRLYCNNIGVTVDFWVWVYWWCKITGPAIRRSLTGGLFSYLALEPEWTMGYGSRLCDPWFTLLRTCTVAHYFSLFTNHQLYTFVQQKLIYFIFSNICNSNRF